MGVSGVMIGLEGWEQATRIAATNGVVRGETGHRKGNRRIGKSGVGKRRFTSLP